MTDETVNPTKNSTKYWTKVQCPPGKAATGSRIHIPGNSAHTYVRATNELVVKITSTRGYVLELPIVKVNKLIHRAHVQECWKPLELPTMYAAGNPVTLPGHELYEIDGELFIRNFVGSWFKWCAPVKHNPDETKDERTSEELDRAQRRVSQLEYNLNQIRTLATVTLEEPETLNLTQRLEDQLATKDKRIRQLEKHVLDITEGIRNSQPRSSILPPFSDSWRWRPTYGT